jgi:hypothetical protein
MIHIPIYDWLMDKLEEFRAQPGITEEMNDALEKGFEKFKEYYQKSEECYMYSVATILDPRLKLEYYKKHKWDKRWIAESKKILSDLYERHYAPSTTETEEHIDNEDDDNDDVFLHLYSHDQVEKPDELEAHLTSPVVHRETDVLQWWKLHEAEFPHLSRMARDYMAIPATSVPVERAFSMGASLISKQRSSLAPETIRACMCLKAWL